MDLKSLTVEITGFGAFNGTATPIPTFATFFAVPLSKLPAASNLLTSESVRIATSNFSPDSILLFSSPAVPLDMFRVICFEASSSGAIANKTGLNAPVVNTLISAACAPLKAVSKKTATASFDFITPPKDHARTPGTSPSGEDNTEAG